MDQTVNAFLDADEDAEIGNILDLALDDGTDRVVFTHQVPWVGVQLFHAEGDAFGFRLDVQHHHLDLVTHRDKLGGVARFFGPGHFRDVDQPLDALF